MTERDQGEYQIKGFDFNLSENSKDVLNKAALMVDNTIGMTYIRPEILLAATLEFREVEEIFVEQGIEVSRVKQKLFELFKPTSRSLDDAMKITDPTTRLTNNARDAILTAQSIANTEERMTEPKDIFYGVALGVGDYATNILNEVGFSIRSEKLQKNVQEGK